MATSSPAHIHTSAAKYEVKPEWYFEKGLRKVKPYLFKYSTYAKERWRGRSVIDVFSSDFRDRSPEYYAQAVASGVIKINGKIITQDVIIRNGDLITNTLHRHEPPVIGDPVRILHRDDVKGLLVVEKPGSMPIHPTGRYNYNTLLSILKFDYDLPLVHTSNRLDRLTSGVMICALTTEASRGLSAYFGQEGAVKKEYIARCQGRFPDEEIVCEEPLLTIDRQVGLNVVHPEGKHAKTFFKKMSYDPKTDSSVVHCRPITGRSHQIRVHLQFLGHPILNDVIYCSNVAWGPEGGKGGIFRSPTDQDPKSSEKEDVTELIESEVPTKDDVQDSDSRPKRSGSAIKLGRGQRQGICQTDSAKRARLNPEDPDSGNCSGIAFNETARAVVNELRKARDIEDGFGREKDTICIDRAFKTPTELLNSQLDKKNDVEQQEDGIHNEQSNDHEFCSDCGIPLLPDPKPEQLFIYLHAFRYHTDTWDFSSGLPWWADEERWKERQNQTIESRS
ncbi:pseudouridine synthase [Melampsora americana]|nr:pseudouridine synthase [Melampsora americana]